MIKWKLSLKLIERNLFKIKLNIAQILKVTYFQHLMESVFLDKGLRFTR